MPLDSTIAAVTDRIRERSRETREAYLDRLRAAAEAGPVRAHLSCSNQAHAYAATGEDKAALAEGRAPNLGIVTAYNDMLSAHQPFETFPARIREAARRAGGTAQVAGGVPAMCDGVTQGQPGMELSLFSRDVIAMAAGGGALPQLLRRGGASRGVRQDRAWPRDRRGDVRARAGGVHPRRGRW